jgi:GNAT superfamily N-acetyltransferase
VSIAVVPLSPRRLRAFGELFEASSAPCFCRFWHFSGTKNDWLDRCANRPEENLAEQERALAASDPTACGLLAVDASEGAPAAEARALGWMKLAPLSSVPKLRGLPVYRALDLDAAATWAIGCLLVRPDARRRGVARALVSAAAPYAREHGAHAVLGFPRRSSAPLHDEEAFQGPEQLFRSLGYEVVHDVAPYPVYRHRLRAT